MYTFKDILTLWMPLAWFPFLRMRKGPKLGTYTTGIKRTGWLFTGNNTVVEELR